MRDAKSEASASPELVPTGRLRLMLGRAVGLLFAALMVGVGAWWTARGLGLVGESPSEKDALWYATVGPVLAGFGVALVYVILRGTSRKDAGAQRTSRRSDVGARRK